MEVITYITKLTEDNIDEVISIGAAHNLNLTRFEDQMKFYAENGLDTYIFVEIVWHSNEIITARLTTDDPSEDWVVHEADKFALFTRVTRR